MGTTTRAAPAPPGGPGRAGRWLDTLVTTTGGSRRDGQHDMCQAVSATLAAGSNRHLFCQAPTGTGKTFAFLVGALDSLIDQRRTWQDTRRGQDDGEDSPRPRLVVVTATKSLQDQLVDHDIPAVARVLAAENHPLSWAVLKGRSNYLCAARLAEMNQASETYGATLDGTVWVNGNTVDLAAITGALASGWDGETTTFPGDAIPAGAWAQLSCSEGACPGRTRCSYADRCHAEHARQRARNVDVIVVNAALYAAHLLSDNKVLPSHSIVVIDEAHSWEQALADSATVQIAPRRIHAVAARARGTVPASQTDKLTSLATQLTGALSQHQQRAGDTSSGAASSDDTSSGDADALDISEEPWAALLEQLGETATAIAAAVEGANSPRAEQTGAACDNLARDIAAIRTGAGEHPGSERVAWIDGTGDDAALRDAPVEVGSLCAELLWPGRQVVACSATMCAGRDEHGQPDFTSIRTSWGADMARLGGGGPQVAELAVQSPFDWPNQALLYVPKNAIPAPGRHGWAQAVRDQVWELGKAAGGRTLALFTSWKAVDDAVADLRARNEAENAGITVVSQRDERRERLIGRLREERRIIICATSSWWAGVDIGGDALVCVTIDRLPFPRPDEPRTQARRRNATARRQSAFHTVDLPATAIGVSQGAGRLIRKTDDKGVVAVLDTRLATASYRKTILDTLPPAKRSVSLEEACAFLEAC